MKPFLTCKSCNEGTVKYINRQYIAKTANICIDGSSVDCSEENIINEQYLVCTACGIKILKPYFNIDSNGVVKIDLYSQENIQNVKTFINTADVAYSYDKIRLIELLGGFGFTSTIEDIENTRGLKGFYHLTVENLAGQKVTTNIKKELSAAYIMVMLVKMYTNEELSALSFDANIDIDEYTKANDNHWIEKGREILTKYI